MPKYETGDFREMRPDDLPFSAEGMTVSEIEAFYKGAKDRNEAVGILADCNATSADQMTQLLSERGLLSGTPKSKKKAERSAEADAAVLDQTVALADEGKTAQEIARIRGVSVGNVYQFCRRHGIRLTEARTGDSKKPAPGAAEKQLKETAGRRPQAKPAPEKASPGIAGMARFGGEIAERLEAAGIRISQISATPEDLRLRAVFDGATCGIIVKKEEDI